MHITYVRYSYFATLWATESNFFSLDELPELAQEKVTEAQIKLCFDAYENPDWQVTFD